MTKRCSFVFGGQQYGHFGDSGKEVIAGELHQEDAVLRGFCSGTEGKPRTP